MITPDKIDKYTQSKLMNRYEKLSQELTKMIIKKIQKNGDLTSFNKAQIKTISRIGGKEVFNATLKQIRGLNSKQKKDLIELFNQLTKDEYRGYKSQFDDKDLDYKVSASQIQLVNTAINRTNKTLSNITKSVAFENKKSFTRALDDLYFKVTSGGYAYDKAFKETVNDLSSKGVTLESNGKTYSLEGVVKMNLNTALTQTANEISKGIGRQLQANGVRIFHSSKCRPSHEPIDDVYMSLKEFQKYEYLTYEPNCCHVVNYIYDERFEDKEAFYPEDRMGLEEIKKNFLINQKQNYYARQVREKKDMIASGDTSDKVKKQLKLAQTKYRTYCKSNDLEVDYSKTWKAGYNK